MVKKSLFLGLILLAGKAFGMEMTSVVVQGQKVKKKVLDSQILAAISGNQTDGGLVNLLNQRRDRESKKMATAVRSRDFSNPLESVFAKAKEAAATNSKNAKSQTTWWGNTGRRNQVFGGAVAILFGLVKGGYDLSLFNDPETNDTANGFNVVQDGFSVAGGAYLIRLA